MKLSSAETALVASLLASGASIAVLAALFAAGAWNGLSGVQAGFAAAALALQGGAILGGIGVALPHVRRLERRRGELQDLTGALSRRSRDLEEAALTDALTGLKNRRYFDAALDQFLVEFARVGRPVGLMILDLDHFKAINDTHGHDVGDAVLKSVAHCLTQWTRFYDVTARLGGEEFALIVPNMERSALAGFADRLREAVSKIVVARGNMRLRVTASIGLVVAEPGETAAAVFKRADVMLYRAPEEGRNRVCA